MREILFRGKRINDGEWVYGYYGVFENKHAPASHQIFVPFTEDEKKQNEGHFWSAIDGIWHTVIPETVGQYTGLTDKNGKKIFEGDIAQDYFKKELFVVEFSTTDVGSCGCCYPEFAGSGFVICRSWVERCEIIGNIHDNPELLKGGEE